MAAILVFLWVIGLASAFTMGGLIHLLIVVAVVMVVFNLISELVRLAKAQQKATEPLSGIRLARPMLVDRRRHTQRLELLQETHHPQSEKTTWARSSTRPRARSNKRRAI